MNKITFSPAMLLGLGVVVVPATAHAQDAAPAAPADHGFYASLSAGGSETKNTNFNVFGPQGTIFEEDGYGFPGNNGVNPPIDLGGIDDLQALAVDPAPGSDSVRGKIGTKTGFAIAGAVGYDFGLIRTEVEASWLEAKISGITVTGVTDDGQDTDGDIAQECAETPGPDCEVIAEGVSDFSRGKLRQLSAMANAWLDIPIGFHGIEPYVGGGVGFTHIKFTNGIGHDTKFAWQVGGGLAIPVGDRLKLTIDYRHRETKRPDFGASSTEGILVDKLKTDAVLFGVRAYF